MNLLEINLTIIFSVRTINRITIAIVLASSILAGSSFIKDHIWTDNVVDFPNIEISSFTAVPIANIKAADSPIILPIASSVPVIMPGKALGNTTFKVVCVWLAPRAKDADLKESGTTLRDSSVDLMIMGSKITDNVRLPETIFALVASENLIVKGTKTANPSNPNIIEGTPVKVSIKLLSRLVSLFFDENSFKYIAVEIPIGKAIIIVIEIKYNVVIIDPLIPPPSDENTISLISLVDSISLIIDSAPYIVNDVFLS